MYSNSYKHEDLPQLLIYPANHIDLISFTLHIHSEWKRLYTPEIIQVIYANCNYSSIDHLSDDGNSLRIELLIFLICLVNLKKKLH